MTEGFIRILPAILAGCIIGYFIGYAFRLSRLKKQFDLTQKQLNESTQRNEKISRELGELKEIFDNNILRDGVTGLTGRHVFEDRLQQVINESKRYQFMFALLFLDIDEFKIINDVLGHEVGDALLKEVGARLKTCIRQVDTICRYSGDEFVFLLPQLVKGESAAYAAQRFLDAISQPFHIDGNELFITASIGISIYPTDGDSGKTLLKKADATLHQAKLHGRNNYQYYHQEMQALGHRELMLNSHLRNERVYQELAIYYQPILNVVDKNIISMEALLRWQHPDFGLIAPREFLHMAENNGRIIPIGEWVLRTVCKQYSEWQKMDFPLQNITVNVSLRQLENPHFAHRVSQILQDADLSPSMLVLEISETVLLPKLELVEKNLNMLHRLGVKIAIDDFGTGYLSLQHLRRFPVSYLKIDGSLTQDITVNKESEAIVRMIIALAESLQLIVIAVGVESTAPKGLLEQMGCTLMQGYLFSHPLLPREFTQSVIEDINAHA